MKMFSGVTNQIGIDLGSSQFRIYGEGGILLSEASVVLLDLKDNTIVGFGTDAWVRYHIRPCEYRLVNPIQNGIIFDYALTKAMVCFFLQKILRKRVNKPKVVLSIPSGISSVSRHALSDAFRYAGVRELYFVPASFASALGECGRANIPEVIFSAVVGRDIIDAGIYTSSGIIWQNSNLFGGRTIDSGIYSYFRSVHGLIIGMEQAEKLKSEVISFSFKDDDFFTVRGRRVSDGVEIVVELSVKDVYSIMEKILQPLLHFLREVLCHAGPDLSEDLLKGGLLLAGRSALFGGLGEWLEKNLGIPVTVSSNAEYGVAKGSFLAAEHKDSLMLLMKNGAQYYGKV